MEHQHDAEDVHTLNDQDRRELENPEIACAVDALMDFMEYFPETWQTSNAVRSHHQTGNKNSAWLKDYINSFLSVPFYIEEPEFRQWLLETKIVTKKDKDEASSPLSIDFDRLQSYPRTQLMDDLESIRSKAQEEIVKHVSENEDPETLEKLQHIFDQEYRQFQKTKFVPMIPLREIVFTGALTWMHKNKSWLQSHPKEAVSRLPSILSNATACAVEIEAEDLIEELKMRKWLEIAPIENDDGSTSDEVIWYLDHLDIQPTRNRLKSPSNFSCSRLLLLVICFAILLSSFMRVGNFFGILPNM